MCPLPKFKNGNREEQPFDLVHVNDVIQHLPLKKGVMYICNIFKSGAKVLITTTNDKGINKDIGESGWYENNLSMEPFFFPAGDSCIKTHPELERELTCVHDLTKPWVVAFITSKCSYCFLVSSQIFLYQWPPCSKYHTRSHRGDDLMFLFMLIARNKKYTHQKPYRYRVRRRFKKVVGHH